MSDQLLRQLVHRPGLLRGVRSDGTVRPRERGGGSPDEASGGIPSFLIFIMYLLCEFNMFYCYSIIFIHHS